MPEEITTPLTSWFRERVAVAEAEVRAAVAREAVKDRLIADQKAQLEIAH